MEKMPAAGSDGILMALMSSANANYLNHLNGKPISPYSSDRLIGRCSKDMARTIRDMLLKRHGIRVKLRPRGPSPNAPKVPAGTFTVRKSESQAFYDDCAIYVIGKTAKSVFKMVEVCSRENEVTSETPSFAEMAKHAGHPLSVTVSRDAKVGLIRCDRCDMTLLVKSASADVGTREAAEMTSKPLEV